MLTRNVDASENGNVDVNKKAREKRLMRGRAKVEGIRKSKCERTEITMRT